MREADAALQQLAACRRVADLAAPSAAAAAAAAGSSPVRAAAVRSYNPIGANYTGSRPAAARAAAAAGGLYSSYEGLAGIASKVSSASPIGRSSGSFSRHLATSAAAAAGCQPGSYGSFGGKSSWSPQRVRPGSAGPLMTSPSEAAAVGSAGQVSHMLKGELQALDSDIAAAEASLQAAAQRLGASSTLPARW
jgi:hypothetical protein